MSADVMPRGDLIDHEHGDGCVCGPAQLLVQIADRPDGYVYVHHALDGRERNE